MKNSRAFTLVELLVVVAIIVVLIALLVPFLGRARENAKTAKCQSNLRQIGVAIGAYAAKHGAIPVPDLWHSYEYGSRYNNGPGAANNPANSGDNLSWPEALVVDGDAVDPAGGSGMSGQGGLESGWASGIFVCPSHDPQYQGSPLAINAISGPNGNGAPYGQDPDHNQIHYGVNGCDGYGLCPQMTGLLLANVNTSHILAADACSGFPRGFSTTGVRGNTPGDALETGPADDTFDTTHSWYGVYLRHRGSTVYPYPTYTNGGNTYPRVPNGANFLFADYHVEWSAVYGHISMAGTNLGAALTDPTRYDRPAPWNYWLNP